MTWRKLTTRVTLIFFVVLFVGHYQNCTSSHLINFESKSRKTLVAEIGGGNGDNYDGKPENGRYCRIFSGLECDTETSNLQSLLTVVNDGVVLEKDNCSFEGLKLDFKSSNLSYSSYNPSFIGVNHGIFERCEDELEPLPSQFDYSADEMVEYWCHSESDRFDVVINNNLVEDTYSAQIFFEQNAEALTVPDFVVTKNVLAGGTLFVSDQENFQISVGASDSEKKSSATVDAEINQQTKKIQLECRSASPEKLIVDEEQAPVSKVVCPAGYISVPSDGMYTTEDFCVMQFEAKAYDGMSSYHADGMGVALAVYEPVSVEVSPPWRNINRNNSIAECRSINSESTGANIDADTNGDGTYDLISNGEWQTIAQNIEVQPVNWTGGVVGNGCLSQGNSGEALCGYDGADPEGGAVGGRNTRAKFLINNGASGPDNELWDIAGNVAEWVKDDSTFIYGSTTRMSDFGPTDGNNGPLGFPKFAFGPKGDYTSYDNSSNFAGLGLALIDRASGAIYRGGGFDHLTRSGVFMTGLDHGPTTRRVNRGFRCSFAP